MTLLEPPSAAAMNNQHPGRLEKLTLAPLAPYATAQRPRSRAEWEDRCAAIASEVGSGLSDPTLNS
jgi:hypothetical protein